METLSRIGWFFLNVLQVLAFFVVSMALMSGGILVRIFTLSQPNALWWSNNLWSPSLMWLAGADTEVHGVENVDYSKPAVFLFNHQSALDIPAIYVSIPISLRFVCKRELKFVPFIGWYLLACGYIFVNRAKGAKAIESLRQAAIMVKEGKSIIAFPEGTRSDDGKFLPFKKGMFMLAMQAGVPIVPGAIAGSRDVMPKNSFKIRPGTVRVNIGRPIPTEGLSISDRDALMAQCREVMMDLYEEIGGDPGPRATPTVSDKAS